MVAKGYLSFATTLKPRNRAASTGPLGLAELTRKNQLENCPLINQPGAIKNLTLPSTHIPMGGHLQKSNFPLQSLWVHHVRSEATNESRSRPIFWRLQAFGSQDGVIQLGKLRLLLFPRLRWGSGRIEDRGGRIYAQDPASDTKTRSSRFEMLE